MRYGTPVFALLLLVSGVMGVTAWAEDVYIDSQAGGRGNGTVAFPHRTLSEAVVRSGNRYLFRRGRAYAGGLDIGGVENVVVTAWGEGAPPLLTGEDGAEPGLRLVSTVGVTVSGLEFGRFTGACILVVGSSEYHIRDNDCHDALYGVIVNAGKRGSRGIIEGNRISRVAGDGIGAWSLPAGAVIRGNRIQEFGNDGIDILGSWGSVVEGNVIHDSVDHPEHTRGMVHSGIKAGGNRGAGGGRNLIYGNTVYRVKNFGIWNRGAVGNVYRDNTCYENGVNFNFVNPAEPSQAIIVGNAARSPTYAAGLRYSVFIPAAADLRAAFDNQWFGGEVNVKGMGIVSDEVYYREVMYPMETGTRFE